MVGGLKDELPVYWVSVTHRVCFSATVSTKPEYRRLLAKAMRRLREKRDISQGKLAEKADLSLNFISELERANTDVSLASLLQIARALDVEVKDLLRGIKAKEHAPSPHSSDV